MPVVRFDRRTLLWPVALLLLVACQPIQRPTTPPAATRNPASLSPATAPAIREEERMSVELPSDNSQVVSAIKDLAGRLGVELAAIQLVSAEAVTWPDAGLGCPRPGMAYIQVPQDGLKIILAANGQEYHYHGGRGKAPFLCENPSR